MWTTKQANQAILAFETLGAVVLGVVAVSAAMRAQWSTVIAVAVLLALGFVSFRRRQRGGAPSTLNELARDERDAYIQLRAWALVGQAAMAALLVLAAIDVWQAPSARWVWPLVLLTLVRSASTSWLKRRT